MKQLIRKLIISASLLAATAQAATITWGPATNIVGDSDVSTAGTPHYAEHWSGKDGTINGVAFTAAGTYVVKSDASHTVTVSWPQGALSAEYYGLLCGSWYGASLGTTLTLNDLAPGQTYQVQLWAVDKRNPASPEHTVIQGGPSLSIGTGQYAVGTFTADAETQVISFGRGSGVLNAVQVRRTSEVQIGPVDVQKSSVIATIDSMAVDGFPPAKVTVTLKDASGNRVPGKTVTLVSSRGKADVVSPASGTSSATGKVNFFVKSATEGVAVMSATDTTDGNITLAQTAAVTVRVLALPDPWTLSDDKINVLRAGDVCERISLKEWVMGRKRLSVQNWTNPDQVFRWPVKAAASGPCEVTLLVNTPEGTVMILSSNSDRVEIKSPESGWQRIPAKLKVGKDDTIKLQLQNELPPGRKQQGEIISLEVITPRHLPIHKARMEEIRTPVGDVQWFQNAGFGIMFQWGNWGYPKAGEKKQPWNKTYEDFNIEAFADKMKSIDPGYIIWSVTWRGSRFSAPLKSVEAIMGSKDYTMEYDFLGKLTDALTKRGIPVFLYYHPGAEEPGYWKKVWHGPDDVKTWEDANVAIWTEIGERLGDKLSGWFVDDGMVQYYPADFYRYIKALKTGNPKRIVSFNQWKFPHVSPYEDMTMGEGSSPGGIQDGRLVNGRNKGLMPHTMTILDGPDWGVWNPNTKINPPGGSVENWQARVDQAKKDKHPISLCILMYEDGTLGEASEALLKQLKR